jgi:tetratricopeptide (TPR) repeat protein/CHAT domain-containing protein
MKIILLLPIFFLLSFIAHAQNADSLSVVKQVDSLIQISRALTGQRDFDKAFEVNAVAEKLAIEKLGRISAGYGSCCFNRGRVNYFKKDFTEAEKWYLDSKTIREKVPGKEHPDYAWSLNNLGLLYKDLGNYEKAEPFLLEAKEIRNRVLGKEHPLYPMSLISLADCYILMGRYEKAEPLNLEAIAIREKILGKMHPEYATSLNNLAILYLSMGNYEKAETLLLESKNIQEKTLGKEHPDYAKSLNNLGQLYQNLGNYEYAEPFYLEAKDIFARIFGKEDPLYAASLNNLANLYYSMGDYEKAKPIYLEAKDIRYRTLGKDHPDYAAALSNLANLYWITGNYENAESLYLEARDIRLRVFGKEDPNHAMSLNNLANLYLNMGYFEKAEPLYLEAKDIRFRTLGKEHPDYALSLNNLAECYQNTGSYEKAKDLYLEAQAIQEKILGKDHPDYAVSLNNLAECYQKMGDYRQSELFYLEANTIQEKVRGKEHPDYATGLKNLGVLYYYMHRYADAEPLFLEAKAICEKTLGNEHPDYASSLQRLAVFYEKTNRVAEANAQYLELIKLNRLLVARAATYTSENALLAYLKSFEKRMDEFLSFTQLHPTPELCQESYNNALFFNGLVLENSRLLSSEIAKADSLTLDIYEKWQGCHRRLAKRYARPIAERKKIAEVEIEAEGYEKLLKSKLPAFREMRKIPTWQNVRDHLKPGEATVEFVHYRYRTPDQTDSIMYAALLVRPDLDYPVLIPLFEEKSLTTLLRSDDISALANRLYTTRSITPTSKNNSLSFSLFELIWKPMVKSLDGVKTVYFSPTGILCQLNLGAISTGKGKILADSYQFIEFGSTRQLVVPNETYIKNNDAVLFGGIQYDLDSSAILASISKVKNSDLASRGAPTIVMTDGISRGDNLMDWNRHWNFLVGTEQEVNELRPIILNAGLTLKIWRGIDATEESFKTIGTDGPSPRVLHLATHGFFFPDPKDTLKRRQTLDENETGFIASKHPLIRSGLLLAGANHAWKSGKPFKKGMENGILTAYEISHMNLSNTELVVLSACETGLGDIQGNEGVYGLQRAFKIAGAKYLIMSLWQVPDKQTSILMTTFYKKWLEEKMTIPEAFRAAQKELREDGLDPYQWAGFVLVE